MMLDLSNISLVAVGSTKIDETLAALDICSSNVIFKDITFYTDAEIKHQKYNIVNIPKMNSIRDYDRFIICELPFRTNAEFCLTIHWDGFIVNTKAWDPIFLKYDYIGAPWPWYKNICGNGGFCLKSRKFLENQKQLISKIQVNQPDDVILCVTYRNHFLLNDCKFAPPSIAYKFSTEYGDYSAHNSFGFHDFKYHPIFKELIHVN